MNFGSSPTRNFRTRCCLSGNGDDVPELGIVDPGDITPPPGLPVYGWNSYCENGNFWFDPILCLRALARDDVSSCANGTSGEEGVVACTDSGGGVKEAVDGSVVYVENTGGETNCVS
ncbi:hypothetical protein Hanom_Chr06g00573961 [Helianthus anomalus]